MSIVVMHGVVSVDGFIADTNDQVGPLFDWYVNGDVELVEGGTMKVSQASADYVREMWASIGSMVIGRHLFLDETGASCPKSPTTWERFAGLNSTVRAATRYQCGN